MGRKKSACRIKENVREDVVARTIAFIKPFLKDLAKWIDAAIDANEDSIRLYLSAMVNVCLGPAEELTKYEWVPGESFQWDQSGELESDGCIDLSEPLEDFLEEYSGDWSPTFESGHGRNWNTILEDCDTLCIGEYFLKLAIWSVLDKNAYTDSEQWDIREEIHDTLYDNSKAYGFFCEDEIITEYYGERTPARVLFETGAKYADRLEEEYAKHCKNDFFLWDAWACLAPEYPEIQLTIPELPEHIKEAKLAFQKGMDATNVQAEE